MLDSNLDFDRDDLLGKLNRRTIDPHSPAPLYYQLYTMLRDAIASGALRSGSKMPSEKELAATFDVSRNTARRALAELATEKMVVRRRGRGTVVDYNKQLDPIHAPLTDLMQGLDEVERNTKVTALKIKFAVPPSEIAEKFGYRNEELCNLHRLRKGVHRRRFDHRRNGWPHSKNILRVIGSRFVINNDGIAPHRLSKGCQRFFNVFVVSRCRGVHGGVTIPSYAGLVATMVCKNPFEFLGPGLVSKPAFFRRASKSV